MPNGTGCVCFNAAVNNSLLHSFCGHQQRRPPSPISHRPRKQSRIELMLLCVCVTSLIMSVLPDGLDGHKGGLFGRFTCLRRNGLPARSVSRSQASCRQAPSERHDQPGFVILNETKCSEESIRQHPHYILLHQSSDLTAEPGNIF